MHEVFQCFLPDCFLQAVEQICPLLAQLGWAVAISHLPSAAWDWLEKLQDVRPTFSRAL